MAAVPSAVRRVGRDRPRLVAVALLALVSLAAAGISATSAERLQSLLNENWRAAYDILVTANSNQGDLAGLLAPNTLSAGEKALTLDDLAAIRAVPGIDVAAPIGEVDVLAFAPRQLQIAVPKSAVNAGEHPQAFRITTTFWSDDGLGKKFLSRVSRSVVIDERPQREPEPASCTINGVSVTPETYPALSKTCNDADRRHIVTAEDPTGSGPSWATSDTTEGNYILFDVANVMNRSTRVTLVDPDAERALLGKAGNFLQPLSELAANGTLPEKSVVDWAESSHNDYAERFLRMRDEQNAYSDTPEERAEFERLNKDPEASSQVSFDSPPYVPLLVRDIGPAPLQASIEVSAFGSVADQESQSPSPSFPYRLPADIRSAGSGILIGSSEVDASRLLNPTSSSPVVLSWPGTRAEGVQGTVTAQQLGIFLVGSAAAPKFVIENDSADGAEVEIAATGYLDPWANEIIAQDPIPLIADGTVPGRESVFSSKLSFHPASGRKGAEAVNPAAVAVGEFTLDGIAGLQPGLSKVPLGAYEPVGSTLISGSSPAATKAVEMKPSITGLGLVGQDTVAIASIASASAWGQDAPINAVRVRVAGVDKYSADAVTRVAEVAQAIERLGFSATVVAGSSPTDVTVHVDNYAFGVTDPDAKQAVGPLGSVTQKWSELGAAARVDLAVSNTSFAILAVALGAAALLLAAVQLAGVPGRRAQASVMRTIGWRRRRIVRWMAAEELVSLAIVAVAGLVALLLASSRSAVSIAVGGSVAALVATSTLAVVLGARPLVSGVRPPRRGKRRRQRANARAWVTSFSRFALRQVAVHRLNAVVQLLATIVVAVAAAAVTVTLIEGRAAAGASALGVFAVDQAFIAQLVLGAIALLAGIVLAAIARRIDLERRREQWATMRAMGWSAGQVRTVQVVEGLIIGVPAVAVAGAIAWLYLGEVAGDLVSVALPIALAAAGVLTVILVVTSWREKR